MVIAGFETLDGDDMPGDDSTDDDTPDDEREPISLAAASGSSGDVRLGVLECLAGLAFVSMLIRLAILTAGPTAGEIGVADLAAGAGGDMASPFRDWTANCFVGEAGRWDSG
jgi:hypothetical protein